jgi:hypothetical protein
VGLIPEFTGVVFLGIISFLIASGVNAVRSFFVLEDI